MNSPNHWKFKLFAAVAHLHALPAQKAFLGKGRGFWFFDSPDCLQSREALQAVFLFVYKILI